MKKIILVVSLLVFNTFLYSQSKIQSSQESILYDLAHSLYTEGRYTQALHSFNDFIDLYPSSPKRSLVFEKIAHIYELRQEFVRSAKMYHKLYEELGDTVQGLSYYLEEGRLHEAMGRSAKALSIYKDIIQMHPNSDIAELAEQKISVYEVFHPNLDLTHMKSTEMNVRMVSENSPIVEERLE